MNKEDVRQRIIDIGIVPVLRLASPKYAMVAAEAVYAGGIPIVEVTMTVPKALELIEKLTTSMGGQVLIGAGTVTDADTARRCVDAGAQFLVGPAFDAEMVAFANRQGTLVMAGGLTPTEVLNAWRQGSDMVKVFPCGNVGGPKYIRALKGPFPQVAMVPTGGVSLATAAAFIHAGAAALGVGTELISESVLAAGNHEQIAKTASQFVEIVREARQSGELIPAGNGKGNSQT